MDDLFGIGAAALRKAAMNTAVKDFILNDEVLFKTLRKAANRYIGGESLEETMLKVIAQNANGFKTSIEFMGENTKTTAEAEEATGEFLRIIAEIKSHKTNATISLDLSHIGLSISNELCLENLYQICSEAKAHNIEVIISAEGADRTEEIINSYLEAQKHFDNLGITLQAYLHRTPDDLKTLIHCRGRIRIVKGAFETPADISLPRGKKLDEVYLSLVEQLFRTKHKCSVATHDKKIQQEVKGLIDAIKISPETYEFESLYGIEAEQLTRLKQEGHPAKIYFVYGREWYLYLCNRIAEFPLNIFRALDDMVNSRD